MDRLESSLPDTISLQEWEANKSSHQCWIHGCSETAAMILACIFAQTTGEGMGCYDWAGANDYLDMVDNFIKVRTNPDWKGLRAGDSCHPDTMPIAQKFAEEWAESTTPENPKIENLRFAFAAALKYHSQYERHHIPELTKWWQKVLNKDKIPAPADMDFIAGDIFAFWYKQVCLPPEQ
jgi:hypothetical protein